MATMPIPSNRLIKRVAGTLTKLCHCTLNIDAQVSHNRLFHSAAFTRKFGYETHVQGQPKALIFSHPPLWYHFAHVVKSTFRLGSLAYYWRPYFIATDCTLCHTLALFASALIQDQRCPLIFSLCEIIGIYPCTRKIAHTILDAVVHRLFCCCCLFCIVLP